ncbi:MAG: RluA family pseudouridine synthase [Paracoccaceae bacterium]
MIEKFIIIFTKKSDSKLDKLILENCPTSLSLSRTKIQDLIKRKMVFDPQKRDALTLKTKTSALERVILYIDIHLKKNLMAENLDVPIIFEDKSLVVFNKPANMVVHPVKYSQCGTLVNFLVYKYKSTLPTTYDDLRPGIIHRLDKDTSGLLVVAKKGFSADSLIAQFKSRQVKKVYLALCIGNPAENLNKIINKPGIRVLEDNSIEVKTYIRRNRTNREIMEVNSEQGKFAISRFSVKIVYDLGKHQKLSLLNWEIETGRTHQIRLHAKFIGHPIFGDKLYKLRRKEDFEVEETISSLCDDDWKLRQMLHAHELSICHPENGESLSFRADLPSDFSYLLSKLSKYKKSL